VESEAAPDHYTILGVGRDASPSDVKKAYRRLSRKYHPDVNPDDPNAAEMMAAVNKAYEVLSDPARRAIYDKHGTDFDPAAKSARELMLKKLSEIIDSVDAESDILDMMLRWIREQEERLSLNRGSAKRDIDRLEKMRKTVRHKSGGGKVIDSIFERKIQRAQDALDSMDHQEEILKAMRPMLEDYECLIPKKLAGTDPYGVYYGGPLGKFKFP